MKKRLLCLSVLLGGMILSSVSTALASETQYDSTFEAQYDLFAGYSEDEKVLVYVLEFRNSSLDI